jgi:transcriptional regulator with XRE-family HTH domain
LRKARRITGVALAKQTGISQSKLSKIETGALIFSTEKLLRLFEALSNVSSFPEAEAQRLNPVGARTPH